MKLIASLTKGRCFQGLIVFSGTDDITNISSLFEAFSQLLHNVANESEQWISQNEGNVMVSFVSIASLEDLKNKIQENKVFVALVPKQCNNCVSLTISDDRKIKLRDEF